MGLFEDLNSIYSIKNEIKSVLEDKGVDMTNYSFPDYPSVISDLSTGGNYGQIGIVDNGTYYPSVYGVDAFDEVVVSVSSPQFVTESLSVYVNGTYVTGPGVDGYSQVVVDVPQSVTGFTEKDVTEKNINIVNLNNSASFVAPAAFYLNSYIETVNLPNCLYLGSHRTWTTELLFFGSCSHLREVSLPLCSTILNSAFQSCSSLSSVYIPACDYLGDACFQDCRSLTSISLSVCTHIGAACFCGCTSLTSIYLPVCEEIGASCFYECSSLTSISLPACSVLYASCFYKCTNLTEVTLTSPSVCKMSVTARNGTVFKNTPISSGTGSIYVPASLVDAYKSASFWSQHSSVIFPIPE